MASAALTKPQAGFLLKAVRAQKMVYASGRQFRVAANLKAKGFLRENEEAPDGAYTPTLAGLEALADYWMGKDAASGCMAYMLTRQEVDAALAQARVLAQAIADRMEPQDDCPICGVRDGDCQCPDEDRNAVFWPSQVSA